MINYKILIVYSLFLFLITKTNLINCEEDEPLVVQDDLYETKDQQGKYSYDDELLFSGLQLEHEIVDEQADQPTSGERFVAIHVNKMGAQETLNPSLVGLWNMAITFLPKNYKLLNIVSATREVVAGVRYNLLVNAQNENSSEIICEIEILEKPWILTEWGDKLRTLQYTNCTHDTTKVKSYNDNIDINDDDTSKTPNYNFNPMFSNKYNDITDEMLKALEEQIIKPKIKTTTIKSTVENDPFLAALEAQIWQPKPKPVRTTTAKSTNLEHIAPGNQEDLKSKINLHESIKPENIDAPINKDSWMKDLEHQIINTPQILSTKLTETTTQQPTTTIKSTSIEEYTNSHTTEAVQDTFDDVFIHNNHDAFEMEPVHSSIIDDNYKSTTETDITNTESSDNWTEFSTESFIDVTTVTEIPDFELTNSMRIIPTLTDIVQTVPNTDAVQLKTDNIPKTEITTTNNENPPKKIEFYEFSPNSDNVYDESYFHKTVDDLVQNLVKELMITNSSDDKKNTENLSSSNDNIKNNMFQFYEFNPIVENEYETIPQKINLSKKLSVDDAISELFRELANVEQAFSKGIYDIIYLEINVKENPIYVPMMDANKIKKHKKNKHSRQSRSSKSSETIENAISNSKLAIKGTKSKENDSNEGGEQIDEINYDNKKKMSASSSSSESTDEENPTMKKIPEFEKIFVINFLNRSTDLAELENIASDILQAEHNNLFNNNVLYVLKIKTKNLTDCSSIDNNNDNKIDCPNNLVVDTTKICNLQVNVKDDSPNVVQNNCLSEKRSKRQTLVGAPEKTNVNDAEIENLVKESLKTLSAQEDGASYSLVRIIDSSRQVVAGIKYRITAEFKLPNDGIETCKLEIWERKWIKPNGTDVQMNCAENKNYHFRQRRSLYRSFGQKSPINLDDKNIDDLFHKFQLKYRKNYQSSMENDMRFAIFKANIYKIEELNRHEQGTAKYGVTQFADYTEEEFRQRTGLLPRKEYDNEISNPIADVPDIEIPRQFDWREKGAITEVKDQGSCGSCWAFSVIGNIEGLHAIKYGTLEEYSEQELVDCDNVDQGCNGGLPDNAYKAIEQIGGLELESEYPYNARKSTCRYNKTMSHVIVKGAVDLPANETLMAQWLVANGPISIGLNANAMQFYRGGVSHPWRPLCMHSKIDHGVLIVGYGVADYPVFNKSLPYWIVKNSWGHRWGEQGYYRVFRGDNSCGIATMASSAVLG